MIVSLTHRVLLAAIMASSGIVRLIWFQDAPKSYDSLTLRMGEITNITKGFGLISSITVLNARTIGVSQLY